MKNHFRTAIPPGMTNHFRTAKHKESFSNRQVERHGVLHQYFVIYEAAARVTLFSGGRWKIFPHHVIYGRP